MQLRAWPTTSAVTPVSEMRVWGDSGGRLDFTLPTSSAARPSAEPSEALAWIVDVPALEHQLAEALRFAPEVEYVAASEEAPAKLTVVCEGRHSITRDELGVNFETQPYQQHAVAARVRGGVPHRQQALQWFHQGTHGLEILALLPLGGPHGDSAAVVWSLPPESASAMLA